ncbi:MAG: hypothetical protein K0S47_3921 [Herbinix sp.]|jgi:hypothetical protein|nr:hypothetical protein [Herbinix sp.]
MKKRMNVVFFGLCFLAAVMAELYVILHLKDDYLSLFGIGAVVLITGYLFFDGIRSFINKTIDFTKFTVEKWYMEETEKQKEWFGENNNIHKATYSAIKKNTVVFQDRMDELSERINTIEQSHIQTLEKLIELQKMSMEGQKKALNLEINYNKENTKQVIQAITEEIDKLYQRNPVGQVIPILEEIKNELQLLKQTGITMLSAEGTNSLKDILMNDEPEQSVSYENEFLREKKDLDELSKSMYEEDSSVDVDLTSLMEEETEKTMEEDIEESTEESIEDLYRLGGQTNFTELSEDNKEENQIEISGVLEDNKVNELLDTQMTEDMSSEESDDLTTIAESSLTEDTLIDQSMIDSLMNESNPAPAITPLYTDPNKALTPEEIAALFASLG